MKQFPTENVVCICGHESAPNARFCNACGNPIDHPIKSHDDDQFPTENVVCTCGHESAPNAKFCNACGNPIVHSIKSHDDHSVAPKPQIGSPFVFWRRIFAFWIDGLVLGALGFGLGQCFYNGLAQLGPYGRLIGFCVCLIYFGFFNSNFGRGRTIGQRLAKIKVVDAQGDYISLGKSLIRAAILWLPMSLNNLAVPTSALLTQPVVFALLGAIVFGLGGALVYLFLFNKKSRQSIHDLIVGAFVVRSDTVQMPAPAPIWRGHVIILLSLFAVLSTAALVTGPMLLKQSTFKGMLDVVQAIEKSGDVFSCEVAEQTNFGGTAGSAINQQKMLIVSAVCKHNPKEEAGTINKLVALVVKTYPKVLELDGLEIELNYGYDIGIASGWQNDSRDLTQAQLLELTGLPAPTELPSVSEEHLEPPKHGERGERGIRRTGRTHSRSEVKRH